MSQPRKLLTRSKMHGIAKRLIWRRPMRYRTSTDVEDAMQDGYLGQVEGKRADWAMIDAMQTWRPNRGKRVLRMLDFAPEGHVDEMASTGSHEDRVVAGVDAQRMLSAFEPRTKEMLLLRFGIGMELHEIAEKYGISESRACQIIIKAQREMS
jgi:RNA polymerase sigma factor (sigma-70 family)